MKKPLLITLGTILSLLALYFIINPIKTSTGSRAFVSDFTYQYKNQTLNYHVTDKSAKTVSVEGDKSISGVVEIPSKVSYGEEIYVVTEIGFGAFCGCNGLTSVTIPASVTEIGIHAFSYCSSLTSVTIPDSVTEIGKCAFSDCIGLTSVTIPGSVTKIGEEAFYWCVNLKSVTIPNSVTEIGSHAFYCCNNLTAVYYDALKPISAENDIFSEEVYKNAPLFLPEEAIVSARTVDPWKHFNKIAAYDFEQ